MKFNFSSLSGKIFFAGTVTGALYLPIVLQMMLGTGFLLRYVQTATLFFFPVCWAALGIGFLIQGTEKRFPVYNLLAGSLFLFFVLAHGLPLQIDSPYLLATRLFACLIPAGMAYYFIGRELNRLFAQSGPSIHKHYGVFLLGLALGTAFSDQSIAGLGGNGLILFLIAVLLICNLRFDISVFASAAVFAAITFGNIDLRVERLRNVGKYGELHDNLYPLNPVKNYGAMMQGYRTAFRDVAWNRRGQTFFFLDESFQRISWVLNLQTEHVLPQNDALTDRRFFYNEFRPGQNILLIGVGAGRSLRSISPDVIGKNIYAVERDGNTVALVRENGLNPVVDKVNYVVSDGRAFLEKSDKKWDWIVIESAIDTQNTSPFQLFQPQFLFTREALNTYLSRLNEGGTFVIEVARSGVAKRFNVVQTVRRSLESSPMEGLQTRYLHIPKRGSEELGSTWIIARRGGEPIDSTIAKTHEKLRPLEQNSFRSKPCLEAYSDASPFFEWGCINKKFKNTGFNLMVIALLLFAAIGEGIHYKLKEDTAAFRNVRFIFLFQSMAHVFLFLGIAYSLRSIFVDEIGTFYIFNVATTLVGAGASFFIHHLVSRSLRIPLSLQIGGLAVSLAWLTFALKMDATFTGGLPIRILIFTSLVVPVYFFSALLFHECLGFARSTPAALRSAFLYDAIAVLPAYFILPWILFEVGIGALLLGAVACYAVSIAFLLWGNSKSQDEAQEFS